MCNRSHASPPFQNTPDLFHQMSLSIGSLPSACKQDVSISILKKQIHLDHPLQLVHQLLPFGEGVWKELSILNAANSSLFVLFFFLFLGIHFNPCNPLPPPLRSSCQGYCFPPHASSNVYSQLPSYLICQN